MTATGRRRKTLVEAGVEAAEAAAVAVVCSSVRWGDSGATDEGFPTSGSGEGSEEPDWELPRSVCIGSIDEEAEEEAAEEG